MAEGARLESVFTGNRNVGSNPTPSTERHPRLSPRHGSPNVRAVYRLSSVQTVKCGRGVSVPAQDLSMNETDKKRAYRTELEFVEAGFGACLQNANDLVASSKNLIEHELHAPALSLAVLALEEVGKMLAIDGLLFAKPEDPKAQKFDKSQRDHVIKLLAIPLLQMLIAKISLADPRNGTDAAYREALGFGLQRIQIDGDAVLQLLLPDEGFFGLNKWKQRGLYVTTERDGFTAPREVVDEKLSKAVYQFAWRIVSTLDFVLMDGNLKRYIETFRAIRSKMTEKDHQAFEQIAKALIAPDETANCARSRSPRCLLQRVWALGRSYRSHPEIRHDGQITVRLPDPIALCLDRQSAG